MIVVVLNYLLAYYRAKAKGFFFFLILNTDEISFDDFDLYFGDNLCRLNPIMILRT